MHKELVEGAERSETDSMKCCPQGEAKPSQRGEPGAQTRSRHAPGAQAPGVAAPGLQSHQSTALHPTLRQHTSSQGCEAGSEVASLCAGAPTTRLPHGCGATAQARHAGQRLALACLWRQEALRVPHKQNKRRRAASIVAPTMRNAIPATKPNTQTKPPATARLS